MDKTKLKADLHVHSKYSHRPASWVLKKIGCAESYTEPLFLYQLMKQRGMDVVTITDHNMIKGCLEIAHFEDTFISEEVTTYFPEDNCKLHVLAYNITENQHEDISKIRNNVFDLVDYLNREEIVHAVAHPMYNVNDRLQPHHFEQILLLFKTIELNGARDTLQNKILTLIAENLTKETIEKLADKYDITPFGEIPWQKRFISGSDDHSSIYMGMSYTEIEGVNSVEEFIQGLRSDKLSVTTLNASPETLAHNIYSIVYQFYSKTFKLNKWLSNETISTFLKNTLYPSGNFGTKDLQGLPEIDSGHETPFDFVNPSVSNQLLEKAISVICDNPQLKNCTDKGNHNSEKLDATWLLFLDNVSEKIMSQFADDILGRISNADLFYLFNTIGISASMFMMLSPYFIANSVFSRDRQFSLKCLASFGGSKETLGLHQKKLALFTDTYNEINGVATAIQSHVAAAGITNKPLTLITCDPDQQREPNVMPFHPIGKFDLPEYPELKVYYPPLTKILAHCYQEGYTHIHAETPGAVGLIGLAVSKMLYLPFSGTYHTSLPQTVKALTGDSQMEDLFWKFMLWFYGQMDRIYTPSQVTANELIDKGIPEEKIFVHQWGVNTSYFHPSKKSGFFSARYSVNEEHIKLLYVGRVSKEKNLHILEPIIKKLHSIRKDIHLIIVGEGPYLGEMKDALKGLPVLFTGYLTGEDLAQAYASSDIFLFPSTVDTMGNVVVEAQASGMPVIVTDKGGPKENLIHEKTGFIVPGDKTAPEHFVEKILYLCDHPQLLTAMQENARAYTETRSFENSFLNFWDNYP